MLGRFTICEETATEIRHLFEIHYTDEVDAPSPLVAGREAARSFAQELVASYNHSQRGLE